MKLAKNTGRSTLCPVCREEAGRLFQMKGFWIRECESCRHRFAEYTPHADHVEDIYGIDYFISSAKSSDGYDDYRQESDALIRRGEYYGSLVKRIAGDRSQRLLDVGAAAGYILEGYRRQGWVGQGIEPNNQIATLANEQWDLPVATGTLENFQSDEQFDLVSMVQVVAHFHDLRSAFERAAEVTKDGGYWLIETWDFHSLTARLLGRHWHEYSPPSVLQWFSRSSLKKLSKQFDMQTVREGRLSKQISVARAKALLTSKADESWFNRTAAAAAGILPQHWDVPYPAEDLFWILLQKKST